jgi:DNA mismatch endonuclease (patch repair protein)
MDKLTPSQRSALMSRIRGKDTMPERLVRSAAHRLGLRFSLHRKDLRGSPDIVFSKHRTVIFVHGCFWHRHVGCRRSSIPASRKSFWRAKLAGNVRRDVEAAAALRALGWRVVVIWECEAKDPKKLRLRLKRLFRAALTAKRKIGSEP